jgi:hypothetical protein
MPRVVNAQQFESCLSFTRLSRIAFTEEFVLHMVHSISAELADSRDRMIRRMAIQLSIIGLHPFSID